MTLPRHGFDTPAGSDVPDGAVLPYRARLPGTSRNQLSALRSRP